MTFGSASQRSIQTELRAHVAALVSRSLNLKVHSATGAEQYRTIPYLASV